MLTLNLMQGTVVPCSEVAFLGFFSQLYKSCKNNLEKNFYFVRIHSEEFLEEAFHPLQGVMIRNAKSAHFLRKMNFPYENSPDLSAEP